MAKSSYGEMKGEEGAIPSLGFPGSPLPTGLERHSTKIWSLENLERVGLADKANVQLTRFQAASSRRVSRGSKQPATTVTPEQ